VARVAFGADDSQTVKAFLEAEAYNGPSLIVAYSPCIQQGYELNDLCSGLDHQKLAVQSGHWPLFRYNPALEAQGKNPFQLDSKAPSIPLEKYIYTENRYAALTKLNEEAAERLLKLAQEDVNKRWALYSRMAGLTETK
jgi:pyruvate-ferredoxin/flavodoxin oxidoreductase